MKLSLTFASLKVLKCLLQSNKICGADIVRLTGLPTGTVYPILRRWRGPKARLVVAHWEIQVAPITQPRRRFYRLSEKGRKLANEALGEVSLPTVEYETFTLPADAFNEVRI